MNTLEGRAPAYRWVVLFVYALLQFVAILLNFTFAPVTGEAVIFYGVTPLQIGFLSMISLIVTLFLQIPGSYAVDTWGIRRSVGLAAVLLGVFGFARGVFAHSYAGVMICTWGFCLSNPFVFNSMTAVAARWFPLEERAAAVGGALMALYCGLIVAMGATPLLTARYGIAGMLRCYGVVSLIAALAFLFFAREAPAAAFNDCQVERESVLVGVRGMFTRSANLRLLLVWFITLGAWNALMTWVEQMIAPRGFSSVEAGAVGAAMQAAGIAGCLVLPFLSERLRKRKLFLLMSCLSLLVALAGFAFASSYGILLAAVACYGFFGMGGSAVSYQYATEVSYPVPEATCQGLLIWAGQISGILFIYGMDVFRTPSGAMTPSLVGLMALCVLTFLVLLGMKESPAFTGEGFGKVRLKAGTNREGGLEGRS
jgi:cyanate permease